MTVQVKVSIQQSRPGRRAGADGDWAQRYGSARCPVKEDGNIFST